MDENLPKPGLLSQSGTNDLLTIIVSYWESQSLCGARLPLTKFDGKKAEDELGSLTRALGGGRRNTSCEITLCRPV